MPNIVYCPSKTEMEMIFKIIAIDFESDVLNINNLPANLSKYFKNAIDRYGLMEVDTESTASMENFLYYNWVYFNIIENEEVNAFAVILEDHQYVGILTGTLMNIHEWFLALMSLSSVLPEVGNSSLENNEEKEVIPYLILSEPIREFQKFIPKCPDRIHIANVMTRIALDFIYFHEVGHLKECHSLYFRKYGDKLNIEFPFYPLSKEQCHDKRSLEIIADWYGTYWSIQILNDKFLNSNKILGTNDPFDIWIFAIYNMLRVFNPKGEYIKEDTGTHPNNYVRFLNIISTGIDNIQKNYPSHIPLKYKGEFSSMDYGWDIINKQRDLYGKIGLFKGDDDYIRKSSFILEELVHHADELNAKKIKEIKNSRELKFKKEYDEINKF